MMRSSASTASSESKNDLKLQAELTAVKKLMNEKDQEYKIQMSRMKAFYDKHL